MGFENCWACPTVQTTSQPPTHFSIFLNHSELQPRGINAKEAKLKAQKTCYVAPASQGNRAMTTMESLHLYNSTHPHARNTQCRLIIKLLSIRLEHRYKSSCIHRCLILAGCKFCSKEDMWDEEHGFLSSGFPPCCLNLTLCNNDVCKFFYVRWDADKHCDSGLLDK